MAAIKPLRIPPRLATVEPDAIAALDGKRTARLTQLQAEGWRPRRGFRIDPFAGAQ